MSPRGATVLPIPPLPFPPCREIRFFGKLRSAPFFIFSSCLSCLFVPLEYVEIFNHAAEFDQRNRDLFAVVWEFCNFEFGGTRSRIA